MHMWENTIYIIFPHICGFLLCRGIQNGTLAHLYIKEALPLSAHGGPEIYKSGVNKIQLYNVLAHY